MVTLPGAENLKNEGKQRNMYSKQLKFLGHLFGNSFSPRIWDPGTAGRAAPASALPPPPPPPPPPANAGAAAGVAKTGHTAALSAQLT